METAKNLNSDERLIAYSNAFRNHYKSSLFDTAKTLLGYQEITELTHGPIINALESETNHKLICVPRGCFKSSIASVAYPIWLLMNNHDHRILIDSELYENSSKFLREIKDKLLSTNFISAFGNWKTKVWNESEIKIAPRLSTKKEASITCGGVGTQKTSQHYTCIIADDLNSATNSNTPEGREKIVDHYRRYTSLLDPGGILVVIGTRYADNDIIGWIIENEIENERST